LVKTLTLKKQKEDFEKLKKMSKYQTDDDILNEAIQQNQTSSQEWVTMIGAAFATAALVPICKFQ
jgi:hypothetical protein